MLSRAFARWWSGRPYPGLWWQTRVFRHLWPMLLPCPYLGLTAEALQDPLAQTVPLFAIEPPSMPAVTQTMDIHNSVNATGFVEFTVNNSSFRADYK